MILCLDKKIYDAEVIQKAAYRFIDRFSTLIEEKDTCYELNIDFIGECKDEDRLVSDFKAELLDQNLRKAIKNETQNYRNLILSLVFSRTGLQE